MDRRIALKNMGLALGYTVATPTLISLIQSCKAETGPDWVPVFFTPEQGAVFVQLADLILPRTDTPSASEVGVHTFIDKYMNEVSATEEQEFVKMTFGKFLEKAISDSGKETVGDLTAEDLEPTLASALKKRSEEEEEELNETMMAYYQAMSEGDGSAELDGDVASYAFASQMRDAVIWAYKTSETVGEKVLAYLPVPGEYIGCGDLNELTGGKAWSI